VLLNLDPGADRRALHSCAAESPVRGEPLSWSAAADLTARRRQTFCGRAWELPVWPRFEQLPSTPASPQRIRQRT